MMSSPKAARGSVSQGRSNRRGNVLLSRGKQGAADTKTIIALQVQFFDKQNDDVVSILTCRESSEKSKYDATNFILVLTVNSNQRDDKTKRRGFGMPRLHRVKVKSMQNTYSLKKTRLLKNLRGVTVNDDSQKSFSLNFNGKTYQWTPLVPKERDLFIWWMSEVCRFYLSSTPENNVNMTTTNKIATDLIARFNAGKYTALNSAQKQLLSVHTGHAEVDEDASDHEHKEEPLEAAKIQLATMSAEEEKDLYAFLDEAGLGIGSIDRLEDYVVAKLIALENESIQELYLEDAVAANGEIVTLINEASEQLDEMAMWMNHNDAKMTRMRSNIKRIETRNQRLEMQEHNHHLLHEALSGLLNELKISSEDMHVLQHPDLKQNMENTLTAVRKLDQASQFNKSPLVEQMQAVKDQRKIYDGLRQTFSKSACEFLDTVFQDVANRSQKRHHHGNGPPEILDILRTGHDSILDCSEIAGYISKFRRGMFGELRGKYTAKFAKQREAQFKTYFEGLKKNIDAQHMDSRMSSFLNYDVDSEFFRQQQNDMKLSQQTLRPRTNGKLLVSDAFQTALEALIPCILAEQNFLNTFFETKTLTASAKKTSEEEVSDLAIVVKNSDGQEGISVQDMMQELYGFVGTELRALAVLGNKLDSFFALNMLVRTEEVVEEHQDGCEFLVATMTALQAQLRMMFNAFVDEQVAWINSNKASAKAAGVTVPFLKFPTFVERMETVTSHRIRGEERGNLFRSQASGTSYQKLCLSLFKWLENVANSDEKYHDVVIITNTFFFCRAFADRKEDSAMGQMVGKARQQYTAALNRYVTWNMEYEKECVPVTRFWTLLEDSLKSVTASDIPFTNGLSKHDLRNVTKNVLTEKKFPLVVKNMYARIKKHLGKNEVLFTEVWTALTDMFLAKFNVFAKRVHDCYVSEEIGITPEFLIDTFKKVKQAST